MTASGSPLVLIAGQLAALQSVARASPTPLIPLKGVELAFGYYRSPVERPMFDVDVLVAGPYGVAVRTLLDAGFVPRGGGYSARALVPPSSSIEVDLHRQLLPPAMGRLTLDAILRETREDRNTFGVRVLRMCPEHVLLHLCGNHVKDRFVAEKASTFVRDVGVLLPHVSAPRFARLAREARLRGTAYLAMFELEPARPLVDSLAMSSHRRRELQWLRRAIATTTNWPELGYALARASCDGVALPLATIALSLTRAVRDRVLRGAR